MGQISTIRVILGGLLAGLVINVGEAVSNLLFSEEVNAVLEELGRPPFGGWAIALSVVLGFIFGILLVWLYAAVRPRFGPGPKTAIIAGLVMWVVGGVYPSIGYAMLGLFPGRLIMIGLVWGLVEISVASVAGAWLYREG